MSDYQPKRNGKEVLPHSVYMQVKHLLLDHERLLAERDLLIDGVCYRHSLAPARSHASRPTERKALRLSYINTAVMSIEASLKEIARELEDKVEPPFDPKKAYFSFDYFNLCYKRQSLDDLGPAKRTWQYYKSRLSRKIAERTGMV